MGDQELSSYLNHLLEGFDDYWIRRIYNSILAVEFLFQIKVSCDSICRQTISPDELWVAATDELDTKQAIKSIETYGSQPPPVTVIYKENKYYLLMGSVRALMFLLSNKQIDAIVVDVSSSTRNAFPIHEAKYTLSAYFKLFGIRP